MKRLEPTLDRAIEDEREVDKFLRDLHPPPKIGDFSGLDGYEFEDYLEEWFRLLGYAVAKIPMSADQGADLIVSKDGEKAVVQARKYDGKVSNKAVQEIVAARSYYKANKAIVVTNSSFTKSAKELAYTDDVELWDGKKSRKVIENIRKAR